MFAPYRGELLDSVYVRFTLAGTATGKTYAVRADQFSDDGWIVVDDGVDLATAGVTVGAKACLFADRMVFLAAVRHRYRYMRLVFPDVSSVAGSLGTATGTHRLGAIVPGHFLEFNRNTGPLQVEYTDTESPTTTTTRARSGVEHMIQDGPSVRSIGMLVTSADPDAPTGHRGEVGRMIRDLLLLGPRGATPAGGTGSGQHVAQPSHGPCTGSLNRDGTVLDQGVPYKGRGRVQAVLHRGRVEAQAGREGVENLVLAQRSGTVCTSVTRTATAARPYLSHPETVTLKGWAGALP